MSTFLHEKIVHVFKNTQLLKNIKTSYYEKLNSAYISDFSVIYIVAEEILNFFI